MWFKNKENKVFKADEYNDIFHYMIKHYVPTKEQLNPKTQKRKQKVDHVISGNIMYSAREETRYFLSKDDASKKVDFKALDNIENLNKNQVTKKLDAVIGESFSDLLMKHIIQKDIKNSSVYKNAQIDRKLFSKIISVKGYNPSKDTAIALAIALKLNLKETNTLISKAGYTLSDSQKKDLIISYFINKEAFDIDLINDALYKLGESTLGRY